jgi:Fe2+ or Zn2+ uptake regulation protein
MPALTGTSQRIMDLFKDTHLLTAVDILEKMPDVNKSTVYRNIHTLVRQGHLKEIIHDKNIASYEVANAHPHHHFICSVCDTVYPITIDTEIIKKSVANSLFTIKSIHIDMEGICRNCETRIKTGTL